MNELIMIIAGLFPAFFLWIWIWKKDPQPEPVTKLLKASLYGALICIPVAIVELFIDGLLFGEDGVLTASDAIVEAFFVAAVPEEVFKLLALWLVLRRNPYFDEHVDGVVYGACVGLGFAAFENVLYLFDNIDSWQSVALIRALFSVPGHYAMGVLMGYYYSLYHFGRRTQRNRTMILLAPIVVHGIYDALLMVSDVSPIIGVICFIFLIYFCIKLHKIAMKKILILLDKDKDEVYLRWFRRQ